MFQLACSFSILIDNVFLITGFNTFTCQCMSWWFSLWCLLWFIIHIASCMFLLCSIKNFTQLHAVIVQESYGNNCCDAKSNMKTYLALYFLNTCSWSWKYKAVQRFVAFSQDFLMYLKVTYAQQGWIYFMKNTEIMKQNYEKNRIMKQYYNLK